MCRESVFYTADVESADAVFVNDYCYTQWMIGDMHADERKFPHRQVHQGYTAVSRLDRSAKAHNAFLHDLGLCMLLGSAHIVERQVWEASGKGLCLL